MGTLKNETYVTFHVDLSLDKNFCVHNKFLYTLFYPIMCGRSHHITNTWIYFFLFQVWNIEEKIRKKGRKKYFATFTCCCFSGFMLFLAAWSAPKILRSKFLLHADINHLSFNSLPFNSIPWMTSWNTLCSCVFFHVLENLSSHTIRSSCSFSLKSVIMNEWFFYELNFWKWSRCLGSLFSCEHIKKNVFKNSWKTKFMCLKKVHLIMVGNPLQHGGLKN